MNSFKIGGLSQERQMQLYEEHEREKDQVFNTLLKEYLARIKSKKNIKPPKNLERCRACTKVYDSKKLAKHIRGCGKPQLIKKLGNQYNKGLKCQICSLRFLNTTPQSEIMKHANSHAQSEDQSANHAMINNILELKEQQKCDQGSIIEVRDIQLQTDNLEFEILDEDAQCSRKPIRIEFGHQTELTASQLEPHCAVKNTQQLQQGDKNQKENTPTISQHLYSHIYKQIDDIRDICQGLHLYEEREEDNQFQIEDKQFSFQYYNMQQLFTSRSKLSQFRYHFATLCLLREGRVTGVNHLQKLIQTPNFIILGFTKRIQKLSDLFIGACSQRECFVLLAKTALAVSRLHKHNVIHRDIKPENILIKQGDDVKVLLSGFDYSVYDNEVETNAPPPPSVYSNRKAKWAAGSYNHDSWALGVMTMEAIKGMIFFRQTYTTLQSIEREAETMVAQNLHRKELLDIIQGTISSKSNLRPPRDIAGLLQEYLNG